MTDFTGSTAQLNILPAQRIDPNAVALLGVYPSQSQPGFANNFVYLAKQPQNTDSYDIRIDENINANNILPARARKRMRLVSISLVKVISL